MMVMDFNPWNYKPQINSSALVRVSYHCNRVLLRQALNKLCHNYSLIYLIQLKFYDFWKWKMAFYSTFNNYICRKIRGVEINMCWMHHLLKDLKKYNIIFCGKSLVVMCQGYGRGKILDSITDISNGVLFWNYEMNSWPKQRVSFYPKQEWYREKNLNLFY